MSPRERECCVSTVVMGLRCGQCGDDIARADDGSVWGDVLWCARCTERAEECIGPARDAISAVLRTMLSDQAAEAVVWDVMAALLTEGYVLMRSEHLRERLDAFRADIADLRARCDGSDDTDVSVAADAWRTDDGTGI